MYWVGSWVGFASKPGQMCPIRPTSSPPITRDSSCFITEINVICLFPSTSPLHEPSCSVLLSMWHYWLHIPSILVEFTTPFSHDTSTEAALALNQNVFKLKLIPPCWAVSYFFMSVSNITYKAPWIALVVLKSAPINDRLAAYQCSSADRAHVNFLCCCSSTNRISSWFHIVLGTVKGIISIDRIIGALLQRTDFPTKVNSIRISVHLNTWEPYPYIAIFLRDQIYMQCMSLREYIYKYIYCIYTVMNVTAAIVMTLKPNKTEVMLMLWYIPEQWTSQAVRSI